MYITSFQQVINLSSIETSVSIQDKDLVVEQMVDTFIKMNYDHSNIKISPGIAFLDEAHKPAKLLH